MDASDISYTLEIIAQKSGYEEKSREITINLKNIPTELLPENGTDRSIKTNNKITH